MPNIINMYDRDVLKTSTHKIIQPLIDAFIKLGLSADFFTILGLVFNIFSAVVFIMGAVYGGKMDLFYVGWGGTLVLLGGLCDVFDGQVARTSGQDSNFGALFDSVLDRYSELFMFLGMGVYLVAHGYIYSSFALFFALMGSLMVSYTRARAEGLGIECKVGLMQRPERILLLSIGAVLTGIMNYFFMDEHPIYFFLVPVFIVGVLANTTALHRLYHCYKETKAKK